MQEWVYVILVPLSAMLFAIGGTGYKWVRRFVLPFIYSITALICGAAIWQVVSLGLLTCLAYCLPYGDSVDWTARALVLMAYPISTMVLGITWWQPIAAIMLIALFAASRAGWLTWKIWELIAGFLMGVVIADLLI